MGNQPPPKQYNPKMEKQKLEIACMKVKGHLEIQRDRRTAQANGKEQQLIQMMGSATRSMVDEKHKAAAVVSDMNFIDACNIIIRCCDILKDRSMHVCESKGNPAAIKELIPIIETIIWSTRHLNLTCLQEFSNMMILFFGANQGQSPVCDETKVDPALKKCFENIIPNDMEINSYFLKLSQKTGITISQMNVVGHEIHEGGNNNNNPFGGNGGQQMPIFVPNIQTQYPMNPQYGQQQQVGNLNINIRVQELPQSQQIFNPNDPNNNFNQQQYQYPPQQHIQYPPQQPQVQYPPQQPQQQQQIQYPPQPQQQQQQYPPQQPQFNTQEQPQYPQLKPQQPNQNQFDQSSINKYNFPQVQLPQFPVINNNNNVPQGNNVPIQQQQQQQQPQVNIPPQQFGGNQVQQGGADSLEERLRRIREGI